MCASLCAADHRQAAVCASMVRRRRRLVNIALTPNALDLARSRGGVMALDFIPPLT